MFPEPKPQEEEEEEDEKEEQETRKETSEFPTRLMEEAISGT
jgi:hypothetical protein